MRRSVAIACCVILAITALSGVVGAQANRVVIYSALDSTVTSEVLKAFERASGLRTEALTLAAAGTLSTRIQAERARPQADIFLGGSADFHAPLAKQGLLQAYRSPALSGSGIAREFYDPDGFWYGWYIGALAIMYNRNQLAGRGGRAPASWDDLINPAFRGSVVLPSPVTTGGGFIFVATQIFRFGNEDRAFAYLKQLADNATFTPTAPAGITLVSRGEATVGMNWGHDIRSQAVNQGFPVDIVFPADTATEIGAVSIIKGGPNPDGARRFVDFMLSRTPQDINGKFGLRYPTRPDVPSPLGMPPLSSLRFVRYDRQWAIDNQARLREKWQREIGK
ncbi:MAG TPA: ABC transporter substrate-binding protein [bacterium]|jgi:iron(III) transport system substrate-binding protein|nr:ABC transporter substrate-binding protein [bacterium]